MSQSSSTRPFEASWLNRFLDRVSQMPGPRWFNFLLIPLTLFVLSQAVVYLLDPGRVWTVQPELATISFWSAFGLLAYSDLVSSSQVALDEFRSAVDMNDEEYSRTRARFIALPKAWGWLVVPAVPFTFLFASFLPPIEAPPQLATVIGALSGLLAVFTFTVLFHLIVMVISALRTINRLYASVEEINIFNLQELYALSALSARIGIIFILAGTFSYIINVVLSSGDPQVEIAVFFIALNTVMAILLFLLPLLGIHNRLAAVKGQVARQNNHVINATLQKLHERSRQAELAEMPLIESQVSALMQYRREINRISTWPWQPQTLRGFIGAISLPIVIWLIQQYLDRIIGG